MGKHSGSKQRLDRIGYLDEQHLEAALNLVRAYPEPVPHGALHRLSTGDLAAPNTAANTIFGLRQVFGPDSVVTVRLVGHAAGPDLADRLRCYLLGVAGNGGRA